MILNNDELDSIKTLNIRKIIDQYPDLVIKVCNEATTFTQVLTELDLSPHNNRARASIKQLLETRNISYERLSLGNYIRKTPTVLSLNKESALETIFIKSEKFHGTKIRNYILKWSLIPYYCAIERCMFSSGDLMWLGKPVSLDLDHANGDSTDNRLENLRFLCPICHSQTDTFKSKNKRAVNKEATVKMHMKFEENSKSLPLPEALWEEITKSSFDKVCVKYEVSRPLLMKKLQEYEGNDLVMLEYIFKKDLCSCGAPKSIKAERCDTCWIRQSKNWDENSPGLPEDLNELINFIKNNNFEIAGKKYGMSSNGIRKHLRTRGIDPKTIRKTEPKAEAFCSACNKPISENAKKCKDCNQTSAFPDDLEFLISEVRLRGYSAVAADYDRSDGGLRKYFRTHGIDPKTVRKNKTDS